MGKALGEAFDKGRGIDVAGRALDLGVVDGVLAEADVAADIPGKQEHLLLDDADAAAQFRGVPLAHVAAIDEDFSALDVVEAAEQADDGGFARAGGPDQR